jgi:hypothetical protein
MNNRYVTLVRSLEMVLEFLYLFCIQRDNVCWSIGITKFQDCGLSSVTEQKQRVRTFHEVLFFTDCHGNNDPFADRISVHKTSNEFSR